MFEGQGKICVSAFDYGKTNVISERKKKRKERGKMKRKTTFHRAGTLRQGPDYMISDDLRKNVPEYSRRLLVLLAG